MSEDDVVVAVYRDHSSVEDAVRQLQKSGYDIRKLSIVGNDYCIEERVAGFYSTSDRVKHWGICGVIGGGTLGLLFGVVPIVVPDLGPRSNSRTGGLDQRRSRRRHSYWRNVRRGRGHIQHAVAKGRCPQIRAGDRERRRVPAGSSWHGRRSSRGARHPLGSAPHRAGGCIRVYV